LFITKDGARPAIQTYASLSDKVEKVSLYTAGLGNFNPHEGYIIREGLTHVCIHIWVGVGVGAEFTRISLFTNNKLS
jgi:hypothetical protein